jgi:hypothetical protein
LQIEAAATRLDVDVADRGVELTNGEKEDEDEKQGINRERSTGNNKAACHKCVAAVTTTQILTRNRAKKSCLRYCEGGEYICR